MFYRLKVKDTAKTDTKVWKGLEVSKDRPMYIETDKDVHTADKAGIEAIAVDQIPEHDGSGNHIHVVQV